MGIMNVIRENNHEEEEKFFQNKNEFTVLQDVSDSGVVSRAPTTATTTMTSEPTSSCRNSIARVVTFDDEDDVEDKDDAILGPDSNASKMKFDAVAATRISHALDDDDSLADKYQQWSLDDFELIQKLGKGGAATVYEAREVQSGYCVALKAQKEDDGLAASEIDIHDSVRHTNIVEFHDYFYANSFFGINSTDIGERYVYSILELCRNGSLYDVVQQQPKCRVRSEQQAAIWIKGAMEALQYLHLHDILHCDVKTANFVIADDNVVKLTDFGFSVRLDEVDSEVEGGSILYMAPEHLIAWRDGLDCDILDEKIDIYGLGVVLFEILVGDIPYAVLEEYDENEDSTYATEDLASCWEGCEYAPQIIDLPALQEDTRLPAPIFPNFVSTQAQDLLRSLLQSDPKERISLEDALCHPWIQNNTNTVFDI
eukprot:scaffold18870_cov181-Amphora_coffeaeformis.AAC.3